MAPATWSSLRSDCATAAVRSAEPSVTAPATARMRQPSPTSMQTQNKPVTPGRRAMLTRGSTAGPFGSEMSGDDTKVRPKGFMSVTGMPDARALRPLILSPAVRPD